MSNTSTSSSQRAWRRDLAAREDALIDPKVREALEREYRYTHGYEPSTGVWLVPSLWYPEAAELVGRILFVEYISRKTFEGPERFIFRHDHEIDHRPWLACGRNTYGELAYLVLGGGYVVTAHGIEDDASDERDVPDLPAFRVPRRFPRSVTGMGKMHGFKYEALDGSQKHVDLSRDHLVLGYVREPRSRLYIYPDR